jgi:hypothetical protein
MTINLDSEPWVLDVPVGFFFEDMPTGQPVVEGADAGSFSSHYYQ